MLNFQALEVFTGKHHGINSFSDEGIPESTLFASRIVSKKAASMHNTLSTLVSLTLVLVAFIFSPPAQAVDDDPNDPDSVIVDSVVAYTTTGNAVVPVSFVNDEMLAGIEITLRHNSTQAVIESFSFLGGRLETTGIKGMMIEDDSTVAVIYAIDSIPAGNGLLGNLCFSFPQGISPETITIDTTTIVDGHTVHSTIFTDTLFTEFTPQFKRGYLDIQEPPMSWDSVWLNDATAGAGQPVAVEVLFFNEENVKDLVVALDYGSNDYLLYDSVSFQGTREMPPYINSMPVQNQQSSHELRLQLTFDDANPLTPGTGLIASLFFTVDSEAPDTLIIIDTTAVFAGSVHTSVTPVIGEPFTPFFTAGSVEIMTSTDVIDVTPDGALPSSFALAQNYPNPFNPTTVIQFSLPTGNHVHLDVFNLLGRKVCCLVDQHLPAGIHQVIFNGRSERGRPLASGVYFYRVMAGKYTEVRKMVLLK